MIPDPTEIIDDTAGTGDTDKTFSADKLTGDHDDLLNQITQTQRDLDDLDEIVNGSASPATFTLPSGYQNANYRMQQELRNTSMIMVNLF